MLASPYQQRGVQGSSSEVPMPASPEEDDHDAEAVRITSVT